MHRLRSLRSLTRRSYPRLHVLFCNVTLIDVSSREHVYFTEKACGFHVCLKERRDYYEESSSFLRRDCRGGRREERNERPARTLRSQIQNNAHIWCSFSPDSC